MIVSDGQCWVAWDGASGPGRVMVSHGRRCVAWEGASGPGEPVTFSQRLGEGGLLLIPLPAAATAAPAAPAILLLLRPRGICYGSSATHPESITS